MHTWPRARFSFAAVLAVVALILATVPGAKLLFVFALFLFAAAIAVLALLSLGVAVLCIRRREWRAAVIEGMFAGLVSIAFLYPNVALTPLRLLSAYGQLALTYPKIASELAANPSPPQPRLLVYETDGFLSSASGLAYDESGEIQKPPGSQSEAWRRRAGNYPLASTCWRATHLIGNYYEWGGNYACD